MELASDAAKTLEVKRLANKVEGRWLINTQAATLISHKCPVPETAATLNTFEYNHQEKFH